MPIGSNVQQSEKNAKEEAPTIKFESVSNSSTTSTIQLGVVCGESHSLLMSQH